MLFCNRYNVQFQHASLRVWDKRMKRSKILLSLSMLALIQACGTVPASGPYSKDIKAAQNTTDISDFDYEVRAIDKSVIQKLNNEKEQKMANIDWPENQDRNDVKVNVGDTIQISIFESESGGLFIPMDSSVRPGNFVTLPAQTITESGTIKVPYAGEIKAAGRTTQQIAEDIEGKLENQAIEPQIVVSFGDRAGAEMSVIGEVNQARRLALGFNDYTILDVIAAAGGPTSPGYETWVELQRDQQKFDIPFDQLVLQPKRNIYAQINDIVYLYRQPDIFNAYGAVQNPGAIPFGKRELTLSEALGLSRGLTDTQADPAEIYIYRQPTQDRDFAFESELPVVAEEDFEENISTEETIAVQETADLTPIKTDLTNQEVIELEQAQPIVIEQTKIQPVKTEPKQKTIKNAEIVEKIEISKNAIVENQMVSPDVHLSKSLDRSAESKVNIDELPRTASIKSTNIFVKNLEPTAAPTVAKLSNNKLAIKTTPISEAISVETSTKIVSDPEIKVPDPIIIKDGQEVSLKQGLLNKNKALRESVSIDQQLELDMQKKMIRTHKNMKDVVIIKADDRSVMTALNPPMATIYKLNMREASGMFLAQKFMMQDQDIIYVANAESVEFLKFLNIINNNSVTTRNSRNAF